MNTIYLQHPQTDPPEPVEDPYDYEEPQAYGVFVDGFCEFVHTCRTYAEKSRIWLAGKGASVEIRPLFLKENC